MDKPGPASGGGLRHFSDARTWSNIYYQRDLLRRPGEGGSKVMLAAIGTYTVEKELGKGGFGVVYLASDPGTGRPVAIKQLLAEGDADLLKRFQLEIRTTASLRHKNIVTILFSGEEAGNPYLVMEFLEGRTLKQVIQERLPLTLLAKVEIMKQVAEGLAYAHSKGVVHRDVKPENIMLLPDGNVKIMDFGIALAPNRNTAVTQTGFIIGTPPYLAPEQLEGLKANEQTDIFSFGDVYYELLTGSHPFEQFRGNAKAMQLAILTYEPRPVGELVRGCPEALETLVHGALQKKPEHRYQRFKELQLESEAILVDLKHELAAAILRKLPSLMESGDLPKARIEVDEAYRLDPGDREVRRWRDKINREVHRIQSQTRVADLLAEARRQMSEERYAEAVQTLKLAEKWDSANPDMRALLQEAETRLDRYLRANHLVSEARHYEQSGLLNEASERLKEALDIDPDHTNARRLYRSVSDRLERRRLEQEREQAMRAARDHLDGKSFPEALAVLDEIERQQPGASDVAKLREEIRDNQAEEGRRLRAERFNLALARTREAMQAGDLERAGPMLDHLIENFAADPGAAEVLPGLRHQFNALIRAREIAQYKQKARDLLSEQSLPEALALLDEGLRKFPDDTGLQRLRRLAEDLHQAQQRSEAIAAVLKEAAAKRDAGDLKGSLDTIREGRQRLGEEAAFVDLSRQFELKLEQQRYSAGLRSLLKEGSELMAAGKYSEAIDRIGSAKEFGGEAEVQALLEKARAAAAIELEQRFVEATLRAAGELESEGKWTQALEAVERGRARYPHNPGLRQAAERLRDRVEMERRRSLIESRRAMIRLEIENRDWRKADALLREARPEFPGDSAFDDLAAQVEAGIYEAGLGQLEARVRDRLAANDLPGAERNLEDEATRTMYARDPRLEALTQEVARRREYESAMVEADRQWKAGQLADAETLLTKTIKQGPPDKRAQQMRDAIRVQQSEALRQEEVARIGEGIREHLKRDELAKAISELATARARYPGEAVWNELQAQLDERKQYFRRQAEMAEAEEGVRQSLGRDDIPLAISALLAARAKFPGEAVWTALDDEIKAREAALKRQDEISAIAESVRGWLCRDHTRDDPEAASISGMRKALLDRRRDDLGPAMAELDEARAKYPGEELWGTLQTEIDARRAFLDAEGEVAERVSQCVDRGKVAQAEAELAAARTQFPDEDLWSMFLTEIGRYRELLKLQEEVGRIAERVRDCLKRNDVQGAGSQLAAARVKYPDQGMWGVLQEDIDARRAEIEREVEIADVTESVRVRLDREIGRVLLYEAEAPLGTYPISQVWDVLRNATARLDQARARYPGESVWDVLQAEIAERQTRLEREITDIVRACSGLFPLDWNASQLAAARARYPGEPFWTALEAVIDARRGPLERASIAEFEARVRERLKQDDLQTALVRLGAARKKHPGVRLWDELQNEIDARQALLKRQEELDAVERSVREQLERVVRIPTERDWTDPMVLQWEAFQKAAAVLAEARAKYPDEDRLVALQAEIGARRAQWEQEVSQGVTDAIREHPHGEVLRWFGPQIRALLTKAPNESVWARLGADLDALEALVNWRAEVAAAGERVRERLSRDDTRQAAAELNAARAKYPDEPVWATLAAEIAELLAAQQQRRREARDRDRDRLVAIGREVETESRKRKRRALDREAQRVAAPYIEDAEIAALAAGIHARIEVAPAGPATQRPVPYKLIGIGAGVVAVAAGLWLYKPPPKPVIPPEPVKPTPIATIPFEIRTDPPGAAVRVENGSCVAPCRLDLQPGSHLVETQLKDYEPQQQTVTVSASNRLVDLTLRPVPPPPPPPDAAGKLDTTGTLVVRTGVPGVLVSIDHVPQYNRTDQSGTVTLRLEAKAHEVQVERNQYEKPPAQQVTITAGAQKIVAFSLVQSPRLELSGAPKDLELSVDGKPIGQADGSEVYRFPETVTPGDHAVGVGRGLLQAVGQGQLSRTVTQKFEPGKTVRLAWKPDPLPPPPPAPGRGGASGGSGTSVAPMPPPTPVDLAAQARDAMLLNADLAWKSLDKKDRGAILRFQEQYPDSPHKKDAQDVLDQLDKEKRDADIRNQARQQEEQDVREALNKLNVAFAQHKQKELKAIWPAVSKNYIDAVDASHHTVLKLEAPRDFGIKGSGATVLCDLTTEGAQGHPPQAVKVTLQKQGSEWKILSMEANR
jgi:serine/threonine protein kinase